MARQGERQGAGVRGRPLETAPQGTLLCGAFVFLFFEQGRSASPTRPGGGLSGIQGHTMN
jgi:hypothetical protein